MNDAGVKLALLYLPLAVSMGIFPMNLGVIFWQRLLKLSEKRAQQTDIRKGALDYQHAHLRVVLGKLGQ